VARQTGMLERMMPEVAQIGIDRLGDHSLTLPFSKTCVEGVKCGHRLRESVHELGGAVPSTRVGVL
jgi:hypothetical protein